MKTRLHRIVVVVRDLDEAIPRYERLFGSKFHKMGEGVADIVGVRGAGAWDVGVLLTQPIKGSTNPLAINQQQCLDSRGESVLAAGFAVDDMDEAVTNAKSEGYLPISPRFAFSQKQLDEELCGLFSRFEETAVDTYPKMGFTVGFNIIEEKK